MLVIHSVINPSTRKQIVLVEESLTGSSSVVSDGPYDPNNPIATGNGVPITGATVELRDPDGIVMTGVETKLNGKGTGIYIVDLDKYPQPNGALPIKMGRRYELTVTAEGMTAKGSTLVPKGVTPIGVPVVPFNRDHQTVNLPIEDVALARAYWLRVDAPVSAFTVFTLDQEVAISGDARNLFTEDLIRVFFPGFLQTLTVAAVDSNLYDYYRSGNDPFSGSGLINRIEGGLGLFGSMVVVEKRQLDVSQDPTGDPIEATYTLRSGGLTNSPHTLRLYVESKGPTPEAGDRVSGSYLKGVPFSPIRGAIFGTRSSDDRFNLQILDSQNTSRVNSTFFGEIRGDTLRGTFGAAGTPSKTGFYVKEGK